jgi:hypothetical protein
VPLSDDQKALLRLLAQREEGYEDIAALMGLSVAEVRSKVKEALLELDEAGAVAASPPPSTERAPERRPPEPAQTEELRPAPSAEKPPSRPTPPPPAPAARLKRSRPSLPKDRRRLTELVGGALVVLLIVLFATGAVSIGGDDSGSDSSGSAATADGTLSGEGGKLTQAALAPVDGSDAKGRALFGRLRKQVVLQVLANGLEPSAAGETYAIWLYRSPKLALRVGAVKVGETGELAVRLPVPTELLALVASGAFKQIYISRTSDAAYKAEVAAAKGRQRLPRYIGETVLRGEIVGPLAEAAAKGS